MTQTVPNKVLEWTNLTLGAVLIVAPFSAGLAAGPVAAWNAGLIGALIITCSCIALARYGVWAEWTNAIAGSWLILAPFVLGFAAVSAAMWTHIAIGLCVVAIAATQIHKSSGASPSAGLR